MMVSSIRFAAVLTLLFGLLTAAHAQTTTYSFQVNWTMGELAGTSSVGSFSFDSALAVPNSHSNQPDFLSSFDLTVHGTFYDLSTVKTGFVNFDSKGQFWQLAMGTHCSPGWCTAIPAPNSLYLIFRPFNSDSNAAAAGDPGDTLSISYGQTVMLTPMSPVSPVVMSPVPEPSTAALWAVGLMLGGLWIRKRPNSVSRA